MPTLIENKKAHLNFEILERFDAGVELTGSEVKSLKSKRGSLIGAFVGARGGEVFLLGADIPPYQPGNAADEYDPHRARRLLLTKTEIDRLSGFESKKGLTIIPISMYTKGRTIKLSIGVARGKKTHDKRHAIKKREAKLHIERELKRDR